MHDLEVIGEEMLVGEVIIEGSSFVRLTALQKLPARPVTL